MKFSIIIVGLNGTISVDGMNSKNGIVSCEIVWYRVFGEGEGMSVSVIVVAAGMGKRMNADVNKQFLTLGGKTILYRTLEAFQSINAVDEIVLVVREDEKPYVRSTLLNENRFSKVCQLVSGGAERVDSVKNGLDVIDDNGIVLIHDGARPLVTEQEVLDVIDAVRVHGAALLGTRVKDTIKNVDADGRVVETYDRDTLWAVATPQGFAVPLIKKAFISADNYIGRVWDDAMMVELLGEPVVMIEGSYENIKITTPVDIVIAESILDAR